MNPAQALEHSRNLQAVDFPHGQADGIVRIVGEMLHESEERMSKTLATKQDLAEMETRMAERDARSSWRMVGAIIAVTAIFGFIIKVL